MKKRLAGLSKVTVTSLLAASLIAPNVASAAPYDIWNGTIKVGNLKDAILNDDSALLQDILDNANTYRYELGGKTYLYSEADAIAVANPNLTPTELDNKIATDLADKAENAPEESTDLIVQSVSAINSTTVKVVFNQAIDPTKVTTANFTILDKNSATIGAVTKAVVSTDKKEVTLTLPALTTTNAPYTLFINKNAFPVATNSFELVLPVVAPSITKADVVTDKQVVLTADVALADKSAGSALVTKVEDLTDSTNTDTVAATTVVTNGKLTIDMTTSGFFKPGHNYKVTIAANTLQDAFGNTNTEAIEYSFIVATNEAAPKMTAVEFFADATTKGNINAIVTFDMPIKDVAGNQVEAKLIDKVGFTTTTLSSRTVKYTSDSGLDTYRPGLTLQDNQMLILEVVSAGTTMKEQNYTLELAAGEVQNTALNAVQNEATSAEAMGVLVDTTAPKLVLDKSQLTSATEIILTFDEAVTYTGSEITVDGFKADGTKATAGSAAKGVIATVTMSTDGKSATLTPKTSGELFNTGVAGALVKFSEGTFVDASENKIAVFEGASSAGKELTGAIDKAAPALVKIEDGGDTNTLSLTFTENSTAVSTVKFTVNGEEFEYNASSATTKWSLANNVITITKTGELKAGDTVAAPAGALKDAAGNLTTEIFGQSK